jgi:hypothetical protein
MKNLSESQLRFIQSTMHVVEEKLRDMEALVYFTLEHCEKGIQVTSEHDLDPQELMEFQHKVTAIRQTLRKISETYGLAGERVSLKQLIGTKAALMWEDVTGAGFDRLKGYGEADESLRGEYETLFDRLTRLTDELIIKHKL